MTKRQIVLVALLVMLAIPVLAACGNKVVATVNGTAIDNSQIDEQVNLLRQQQPTIFKGREGKKQEQILRRRFLDVLISEQLMLQEAERLDVKATQKEVDEQLKQVTRMFPNKQKFAAALSDQGMTLSQFEEKLRRRVIINKIRQRVTRGATVSDAEIAANYDQNKAAYQQPALDDRQPARQLSLDEAKDRIRQQLVVQKERQKFAVWLERLKKKATIVNN